MKKILSKLINKGAHFAIRTTHKGSQTSYHPMVRAKGWLSDWTPIVKFYNTYIAIDLEVEGGLSRQECMEHIEGYKKVLKELEDNSQSVCEYEIV